MIVSSCRLPLRDPNLQARLHDEEGRVVLQFRFGLQQLKLVFPEQKRERFVHLEQSQVLADAEVAAAAELLTLSAWCSVNEREVYLSAHLEHVPLHIPRIAFEPPLRPVELRIPSEDGFVAMENPPVQCDSRPAWERRPVNLGSFCRH